MTSSDVCEIYDLLHKEGLVSFPVTEEARRKVDTIIANITSSHFGIDPYPTIEEKVVAYLYFLINDHPFTDGNKRTATLVFITLCEINNLKILPQSFTLDQLVVYLEKTKDDHHILINTLAGILFSGEDT